MTTTSVLFDLYGTLLVYGDMGKAWNAWIRDVRGALARLGVELEEAALRVRCDGFFTRTVEPLEGLAVYETRLHLLALELGGRPSLEWSRATAQETMRDWQREIPADPEALPLLRALHERGMRCGVLTNFDYPSHVRRLLELEGFAPYLDAVVISGEVGLKKPDPRIFALALERLGVSADETVFVGDHPDQDMRGAVDAGLRAVLVQRGGGLAADQVDFRLDARGGDGFCITKNVNVPVVASLRAISALLLNE